MNTFCFFNVYRYFMLLWSLLCGRRLTLLCLSLTATSFLLVFLVLRVGCACVIRASSSLHATPSHRIALSLT